MLTDQPWPIGAFGQPMPHNTIADGEPRRVYVKDADDLDSVDFYIDSK